MCQRTLTPESGNTPHFQTAYEIAFLVGDCRAIAEALPAIIPNRSDEVTLDAIERISSLASALGRLIKSAEDRAYNFGESLHTLHREINKGV